MGNDPLNYVDPTGLYGWKDFKRQSKSFGTGVAAFAPIKQTNWARAEVRQSFDAFHASRTDLPKALHVAADILSPPRSQGDAVIELGLAMIPFGLGKAGKVAKVANKVDNPADFLFDWARKAADEGDAFYDATKWGHRIDNPAGTTILGHYQLHSPNYVEIGRKFELNYFNAPAKYGTWEANQKFLD